MRIDKCIIIAVLVLSFSCKDSSKNEFTTVDNTANVSIEINDNLELEIYNYKEIESFFNIKDNKIHVINFWATWCLPCIKELPYFETINTKYNDVEVLLVSLDFPNQYDKKLKPYIKENQLKSKVVALNDPDMNTWIPKVDESWSGAIPATIIYNKDKRKFYESSFTIDELESEIKQFLK